MPAPSVASTVLPTISSPRVQSNARLRSRDVMMSGRR
jgi:hypothetical protein